MKKIFSFAMAAMLLMMGCVKENISLNENGGKATVTITATLPMNVEISRAGEANLIKTVAYVVYDKAMTKLVEGTLEVNGKHANLNLDLIKGETYNVAFWAQAEGTTPFTFNAADATVKADYAAATANSEVNDVFFAVVPALTIEGPVTKQVTMARPLAQVNLGVPASELKNAEKLGVEITKSQIKVTKVATKFDLFANKISEREDVTFQMAALPVEPLKVNDVEYAYLAYAYLFVEDTDATDLTYTLASDSKSIKEQTIPMVNFKRNHRTNILGRLITGNAGFDIEIDDSDIPDQELSEEAKLHLAMACDGTFTLSEDMQLTKPLVLEKGVEFTLDLGGKEISGDFAESIGNVLNNEGTLTIKNGKISSLAENGSRAVMNYGVLVLEDVEIVGAPSNIATGTAGYAVCSEGADSKLVVNNSNITGRGAVSATDGAKIEINGGIYHTPAVAWGHAIYADGEGTEVVVNDGTFSEGYEMAADNWGMYQIFAGNKAKVIVNGGKFMPWDCANGYDLCIANGGVIEIYGGTFAEDPSNQNGNNFVADGMHVIPVDGLYYVVPENVGDFTAVVESTTDFATAIATNNGELTLFEYNNIYYVAEHEAATIYPSSECTTTNRYIVEASAVKDVTVAEGMTVVGNRTFRRCAELESVTLPSTLTEIGPGVFQSCSKLANVTIPDSVTVIGEGAFAECVSLTSINIPTGVTRIEKDALRNTGLVSVEFHEGVTYFGTYAMRDCENLSEVIIKAPSFTVESDTFLNAAAPNPTMTVKVANAEMKAYLESTLDNYHKTFITVVVME